MAKTLNSRIPEGPVAEKWTNYKAHQRLVNPKNKLKLDIIVVGTGLAGASAAASLGEMGFNILNFCIQDSPRRAHSIAAQGGINAAKNYQNDGDSVYRLFYDTVKGGDYRAREANVYRLAEVSNDIIDQCVAQGVPFAREYGGMLANRSFGGAQVSRTFYYKSPDWFRSNAGRYDNYDRKGPKVFAGEYAAHAKHDPNSWEAALSEAAFMTGLERNADVVYQATYAPLFAHVEGWQWRPDLIWFDNLTSVRSANYYVQQLYGLNKGTHVLSLTENGKTVKGENGLYATACFDKHTKSYIVKIANTSNEEKEITVTFNGLKKLKAGKVTVLHADDIQAENKIDHKNAVVPVTSDVQANGNVLNVKMKANSFAVYRF